MASTWVPKRAWFTCHCERSEAISMGVRFVMGIASSLCSSQ
jgi:hypothetical protein